MESVKETVKIRVCKGGAWEIVDEVCDDLEVNEFMEFVVKSIRIVTLCIVEPSVNGRQSSNSESNQQSNFIHATSSLNVYQTEYHATQIHQTQIPSSGGFYQNLPIYQQMHGFSGNPMYVPGFLGYPMQDPQSDSANRKLKQVVDSVNRNERDLLDDEKLRPFGEKIMGSVFGKVKRLSGEDKGSESMRMQEETTPSQAGRDSKCYALQLLRGTPEESFAELPLYCHNLKLKNQGTITHIETDDEDRFEIFFLAIGCCGVLDFSKEELFGKQWAKSSLPRSAVDNGNYRVYLVAILLLLCDTCANLVQISLHFHVSRLVFVIYDVGHPSEWDKPDGLITVLSPVMDKRLPGRPRNCFNCDRFRSKGEQITPKSCTRCFKGGHNRRDCPSVVPSQIFIPTTSSVKSVSSWNEEI
ncbi:retrovirus-related pol polyprotein from transposon TNT 1-94 [Tanacetum coccineum]